MKYCQLFKLPLLMDARAFLITLNSTIERADEYNTPTSGKAFCLLCNSNNDDFVLNRRLQNIIVLLLSLCNVAGTRNPLC